MEKEEAAFRKRTVRDSLFTELFKEKQYVLMLYKDLHPEDTQVTEDDIKICTLETVLTDSIYNDLGFTVKDKLIMLVEAQTIWDRNITFRMLMYIVQTYVNYISDSGQDIHQKSKLRLPYPELYVIYTGGRDISEDELSLSKMFFGGRGELDLKIKLLNRENDSIYGQYISFCRILGEQRMLHKDDPRKALSETVRICIEQGMLIHYLMIHKKEVSNMRLNLFDQDTVFENFLAYKKREWEKEQEKEWERRKSEEERKGREEGERKGREEGERKGREEGERRGREEGERKGREKRDNELIQKWREKGYTEEQIAELLA